MELFSIAEEQPSINVRELYAVAVALATWGADLCGSRIIFHVDNMSVVSMLNKGSSTEKTCSAILRGVFFTCAQFHLEIFCVHIPGVLNIAADAISRKEWKRFRENRPAALTSADISLKISLDW